MALDSIILLFNFIHDKDLFHRCYARLLAHRIISFSSVSDEAEKRMMRHLRTVCGYQYAMTFQVNVAATTRTCTAEHACTAFTTYDHPGSHHTSVCGHQSILAPSHHGPLCVR